MELRVNTDFPHGAEFGQRLKAARLAVDLTQTELADRFGVTLNAVWLWEQGIKEPQPKNRRALIKFIRFVEGDIAEEVA